jgi:hypothetical protein
MARNRIIYQSQALYVGEKSDATANKELHRVQDVSFNVDVPRVDINEFGQLSQLSREITEPPTVSLDFSYYLTNGVNEERLGFSMNETTSTPKTAASLASSISRIIETANEVDELNYYVVTKPEGKDAHENANTSSDGVIAIGNGFVTSYSVEAAVGDYPTASVSVEAANLAFGDYDTVKNPAINEVTGDKEEDAKVVLPKSTNALVGDLDGLTALRSGDITVEFFDSVGAAEGGLKAGGAILPGQDAVDGQSVHVQNFSVETPLARTPLNKIGNFFPFSREIDFPITGTFSMTANLADIQAGSIYDMICGEDKKYCAITFKDKCSTSLGDGGTAFQIVVRGATLDSQNFGHTLGDMQTVDLTFSVPLGANDSSGDGIFFCGAGVTAVGGWLTARAVGTGNSVAGTNLPHGDGEGAMVGAITGSGQEITTATYQGGVSNVLAPDVDGELAGSGARVAVVEDGTTAGDVGSLALTKPGVGYVAADIIQVLGGEKSDGTGAVAHDIQITDGGGATTSYANGEILTLSGGSTAAKLKVISNNGGVITKVSISGTDHGEGYSVGDELTNTSTTGSGADDAKFKVTTVFGGGTFPAPAQDTSFAMISITGNGSGGRCELSAADGGTPTLVDQGSGFRLGDLFTIANGNTFVGEVLTVED